MSKKGLNGKDAGFKVPENYFRDFETRFIAQLPAVEENPMLAGKSSPFKVPTSYFDDFETRLTSRIGKDVNDSKVIPLFIRKELSYLAGVAAVLAIILSTAILSRTKTFDFNDLDVLAVENYLLESFEFSSPEEIHLLKEGDFSFATSPDNKINREAVLEYLNENIEDPSLLLNEE
jgi:hypothetical protein